MLAHQYLELMKQMAQEAGGIALRLIADSSPSLKADNSVITKADSAISGLFRQKLKSLLATEKHILIDEEDIKDTRLFNQAFLESVPYVWVIDPIDGTKGFANRMPMFGISIGLLKSLKPWLGMIYLPILDELFYCDGEKSYFV